MNFVILKSEDPFGSVTHFKLYDHTLEVFREEFVRLYVENGRPFRITESGSVIFEGITYGKIDMFMRSLPRYETIKNEIAELNEKHISTALRDSDLFSVFESDFESDIIALIHDLHAEQIEGRKQSYTFKTPSFVMNGCDMVLFSFNCASSDLEIYAVPVELAKELELENYNHQLISRNEPFLYELKRRGAIDLTGNLISCFNND